MSVVEGPKSAGLVARVQGILLRPKAEWDVIDTESATTQGLFTGYACILAAIPAVAGFVGGQVFGYGGFVFHYHPPLVGSIIAAVVTYGLSLLSVFLLAFVIDALAPSFDGQKNQIQGLKVAVYSSTAGWMAGIFGLFPPLAIIGGLCALYGLYLLYLGLPKLMKAPQEKALGYTIVTIIVAVVLYIIVGVVVAAVTGGAMLGAAGAGALSAASNGDLTGTVHVNGANVDLGKLQAASAAATAAAVSMQAGQVNGKSVAAVDPEKLKSLLPATVAGMPRTEVSSETVGSAAMAGSKAEAVYANNTSRITVTVTDLAAMGAITKMVGAMGVQASRQTATGYDKTSTVNGRLVVEKWNTASKSGEYSVVVAGRFAIEAEGNAGSMDDLKAAVASVGPDRLEGLAKA